MTSVLEEPRLETTHGDTIEKVAIVVSKGSLEGVCPGLIMANGARMDGIEADLFFTFFGLDAIRRDRYSRIKVATVGNPGLHMPTLLGALPGFSAFATKMMQRQMEKIDIRRSRSSSSSSPTQAYSCSRARRASTCSG
jgi:peroxiredoxin family protein